MKNWWKSIYHTLLEMQTESTEKYNIALHNASLAHFWTSDQRMTLYPKVRSLYDRLAVRMENRDYPVRIHEGFRKAERQMSLYRQGRQDPGNIVTNALPFQSYHQYGLAADIIMRGEGWNAPEGFWLALKEEAEKLGLESGYDWGDKSHIQYRPRGLTWKELKPDFTRFKI